MSYTDDGTARDDDVDDGLHAGEADSSAAHLAGTHTDIIEHNRLATLAKKLGVNQGRVTA